MKSLEKWNPTKSWKDFPADRIQTRGSLMSRSALNPLGYQDSFTESNSAIFIPTFLLGGLIKIYTLIGIIKNDLVRNFMQHARNGLIIHLTNSLTNDLY